MDRTRYFYNLFKSATNLGYKQQSVFNIIGLRVKNEKITDDEILKSLNSTKNNQMLFNGTCLFTTGFSSCESVYSIFDLDAGILPFEVQLMIITISGIFPCFFSYRLYHEYNSYNNSIKLVNANRFDESKIE